MHLCQTLLVLSDPSRPPGRREPHVLEIMLQGSAKRRSPGLVNLVAIAYHFSLALPSAFTQPVDYLSAELCILYITKHISYHAKATWSIMLTPTNFPIFLSWTHAYWTFSFVHVVCFPSAYPSPTIVDYPYWTGHVFSHACDS